MDDSFSLEHWRMDWGFGNPNKTAALIALLMIAVWGLAYIRKWGFWAALTLFTGFGVCLILTQSRGGAVALLMGCMVLVGWAPRPFSFPRSLGVITSFLAMAILAWVINAESRYTQGFLENDRSIDNRLLIWQQVPAMIHDAPNGWGLGQSGDAYMQWYQPITRGEGYRTLVNSHLTWLVELNWWGRIAYVLAWAVVFVLLWPCPEYRWFSVPWAIWIAFGICASFSSVAESLVLWLLPVLTLISVLAIRFKRDLWPRPIIRLIGASGSILVLVLIFCLGLQAGRPFIYSPTDGYVILELEAPEIWLVAPNREVLGEHFGHEVRRGMSTEAIFRSLGIGVTSEPKRVPQGRILVFSGKLPLTFAASIPSRVILINPETASPATLHALSSQPKVTVILGEYSRNKVFWNEQARSHPNITVQVVEGTEEYIPNWMSEVAKALES